MSEREILRRHRHGIEQRTGFKKQTGFMLCGMTIHMLKIMSIEKSLPMSVIVDELIQAGYREHMRLKQEAKLHVIETDEGLDIEGLLSGDDNNEFI